MYVESKNRYKLKLKDSLGLMINEIKNKHVSTKEAQSDSPLGLLADIATFAWMFFIGFAVVKSQEYFPILRHGFAKTASYVFFAVVLFGFILLMSYFEDKHQAPKATHDKRFAKCEMRELNIGKELQKAGDTTIKTINLEVMLRYLSLNGLNRQAKDVIDKHMNLGVVAQGLTKLQKLDASGSDEYKKLLNIFFDEMKGLEDDLFGLTIPLLTRQINELVVNGKTEILPDKVKKAFADQCSRELLSKVEGE